MLSEIFPQNIAVFWKKKGYEVKLIIYDSGSDNINKIIKCININKVYSIPEVNFVPVGIV